MHASIRTMNDTESVWCAAGVQACIELCMLLCGDNFQPRVVLFHELYAALLAHPSGSRNPAQRIQAQLVAAAVETFPACASLAPPNQLVRLRVRPVCVINSFLV